MGKFKEWLDEDACAPAPAPAAGALSRSRLATARACAARSPLQRRHWSWRTHCLCTHRGREAVLTVLLVAQRLERRAHGHAQGVGVFEAEPATVQRPDPCGGGALPVAWLPEELWLRTLAFAARGDLGLASAGRLRTRKRQDQKPAVREPASATTRLPCGSCSLVEWWPPPSHGGWACVCVCVCVCDFATGLAPVGAAWAR